MLFQLLDVTSSLFYADILLKSFLNKIVITVIHAIFTLCWVSTRSLLQPIGLYFGIFCTRNAVPCKLFSVPGTTTPNSQKSLFVVSGRYICQSFFFFCLNVFLRTRPPSETTCHCVLSGCRSLVLL